MENLINALQKTILLLKNSESTVWSSLSVDEIIQELDDELQKIQTSQSFNEERLGYLFVPTSGIQETSIANGWGNEFLEISIIIDQFTT